MADDISVATLVDEARVSAPFPEEFPTLSSCLPLPDEVVADDKLAATASPWLDTYISHSLQWSPRSHEGYHEACALWILSTVAARRVAIHFGKERYTSLYICLTGRSSIYAKSTAASVAIQTMEDAKLDHLLAPDDATPAAFVASLVERLPNHFDKLNEEQKNQLLKRLSFCGQRGWFYEEFGSKVASMMRESGSSADFRGLLRKFDDAPRRFEYQTVGRGADIVRRPYLSLLACLTPADLAPFAKKGSALWGDGFLARFVLCCPESGQRRSRAMFPKGERRTPLDLINQLQHWDRQLGNELAHVNTTESDSGSEYTLHIPERSLQHCAFGDGVYDAYARYDNALLDIIEQSSNTDLDGNYARLPEKALRVAMLLASLENGGTIELSHWYRGQQVAERWRCDLHALYDQVNGVQQSMANDIEERVLTLILRKGIVTARQVAQSIRALDTNSARTLMESLVAAGELESMQEGKKRIYALSTEGEKREPIAADRVNVGEE